MKTGTSNNDPVHPNHYQFPGGVEPIDIAKHLSFNLGNVIKYAARAGRKGDAIEDLRKARRYLDAEITRLAGVERQSFGETGEETDSLGFWARYKHDGKWHYAPDLFDTDTDAQVWLQQEHQLIDTGRWTPPASRDHNAFGGIERIRSLPTNHELSRATYTHRGRTYTSDWLREDERAQAWLDHEQQLIETDTWMPAIYRPPAIQNPWGSVTIDPCT